MSSEIIRTKSDLSESERVKECLIDDFRAQGILLDSLWAHVYDPTKRSYPIDDIEQLRDGRETLIATVEAKDLVIDDLSFRLAVATPLPADGCSTTELLIVDLSNRVEELAGQLSTSEEKVSGLTLEVSLLMEEKKILIEELSIERDNANHLQIVEEMMTLKLEEVSADAHNLRVENEQLRSSLATAVQEKQVLGNQLLSAQKEVASLAQECDVASELLVLCEEHEAALVEELEKAKTDFEGEIQASKATENRLVEEVARKSLELRLLQQQFSNLEVTKAKELKDQEAKLSKVETNNGILRLTANELRNALGDRDKKIVKADLVIGELKSEIESLRHDLDRKATHVAALPSPPEEAEDAQNQHQPPATPTFAMDPHPQALSSNSQSNPQSMTRHEGPTNSLRTYPIPTVVSDRPYSSRPHSSRTSRWVASQEDGIIELGASSPQYTNSSYPSSYGNGWRGGRGRRWHGGGHGGNPPYDH
ncbi:hypothetical protein FRC02_004046 [Tulasnella sp. 418]|nr:hypothetical protein FRC02_004046 [Tulasnella sp. 418]